MRVVDLTAYDYNNINITGATEGLLVVIISNSNGLHT